MTRPKQRFHTGAYGGRVYDLDAYRLELHPNDCRCRPCRQSAPVSPGTLEGTAMGKLACAGALVGTAIAFIIDPAGAAAALLSVVGL
jgi:hypothetical protein